MNKKGIIRVIGFIMIIFTLVMVYRQIVTKDYLFVSKDVKTIPNWTYKEQAVTSNRIPVAKNQTYTLETDYSVKKDHYLLLRSSLATVEVLIDNQLVYNEYFENEHKLNKPLASLWHLVKIPADGQHIKVSYNSPYAKMSGLVNPVVYGDRGDLLFYIYDIYGPPFLIDGLILFFGILMVIIAFINPKEVFNSIWQIGMFSILVSFWLIAESRMLQFFAGSEWLIGSLAYISLALIPIPMIYYIKNFVSKESQKLYNICIPVALTNLILIITLQLFGIRDFFETLWITHGFMIVIILITIKQLHYEIRIKRNKLARHFLISLSILFTFIVLDFYRFYAFDGANVTLFVRVGLLTFILLLGLETGKQLVALLKKSYQAAFYEQLAYKDQLTQAPNRAAFNKDLDEIFENEDLLDGLRLVILDMNQLKRINDVYGHVTGDEAIVISYNLISKHFSHLGQSYRLGGDEFAIIILDDDACMFESACKVFTKSIATNNKYIHYPIGIALGSVTYDPNLDTSVKNMMHRADTNMYQAKKAYKTKLISNQNSIN